MNNKIKIWNKLIINDNFLCIHFLKIFFSWLKCFKKKLLKKQKNKLSSFSPNLTTNHLASSTNLEISHLFYSYFSIIFISIKFSISSIRIYTIFYYSTTTNPMSLITTILKFLILFQVVVYVRTQNLLCNADFENYNLRYKNAKGAFFDYYPADNCWYFKG